MAPMTDDKVKRRLTTVLCADVYGYSRLMAADETGTLETLRRYRTAIARLVERHDGRIVNTWGDAVIAENVGFARAGYDGVGVREIASDAGVTAMMVTSISGPKSSSDQLVTVLEAVFAAIIETPTACWPACLR